MAYYYLAVDFGESHVGLSVSNGILAQPLPVFNYPCRNYRILRSYLKELVERIYPKVIVVGIPSNNISAERIKKIFLNLIFFEESWQKMIVWANEDYSTQEAILLRKKRRIREDSIAASIILENYLLNEQ